MKKIILTSMFAIGIASAANATITSPELWPHMDAGDFGFVPQLLGIPDTAPEYDALKNQAYTTVQPYVNEINAGLADYTSQINSEFAGIAAQIAGMDASANIASINAKLSTMSDDLNDRVNSGVATANAFAGLDNHLDADKKFGIGVGAGYYESTGGFAFGGVLRTSSSSALNAGLAVSTIGDFAAKAGWNMQF